MADATVATKRALDALRLYREADTAMNDRTRASSSMSENEMRIVQFLLTQAQEQQAVTPTTLSRYLGVTSASMTALLDRLERAGAIERVRHPSDRRSLLITATPLAERTVGAPIMAFEEATKSIAAGLSEEENDVVVRFLEQITQAADAASRVA